MYDFASGSKNSFVAKQSAKYTECYFFSKKKSYVNLILIVASKSYKKCDFLEWSRQPGNILLVGGFPNQIETKISKL